MREWIEVKESAGKGLGIFATAEIPCGARVLAEEPLLKVDEENGSWKDVLPAFEKLSVSQKNSYLQLREFADAAFKHSAEQEIGRAGKQCRKFLAIWAAYAFGHVSLLGSRFNHSCIPNIHFAYDPYLGKETFHAVRNITAGEEVTIVTTWLDHMTFYCNRHCPVGKCTYLGA
jgi:SET domain-containing protein